MKVKKYLYKIWNKINYLQIVNKLTYTPYYTYYDNLSNTNCINDLKDIAKQI